MAIATYDAPNCAEECGELEMPPVNFNDCAESVVEEEGEICDLFVVGTNADGSPKARPSDWKDAVAWQEVLSQTEVGKIRKLTGIGDLPEPTSETRTISKRRIKVGRKTFTLNFDTDDMSAENRTFLRTLQCGATVYIWYATIGGGLYGGQEGIKCDVTKANIVNERGENTYTKGLMGFQWEHKASPEWTPNPLAAA